MSCSLSVVTMKMSVLTMTAGAFLSFLFISSALAACPGNTNLFITAPQTMEALSGSCLIIPCNFSARVENEFDSRRDIFAVWIKTDPSFGTYPGNVIFNSSRPENQYPMTVTGNMKEKNCTTLFSNLTTNFTDTYYFRMENRPLIATAVCQPLQINIKDSPARPTLEVSGDPTDLKENQTITITCSAPTPCPHSPPGLTWSLQHPAHSQMEEDSHGLFRTKIQQVVTLSDKHDGLMINCSAVYPVGGGEKTSEAKTTLNVSYAPKDTLAFISPSGLVSAGTWVSLNCSSRAKPAASYTWFKTSDHGAVRVSEGNFHSFNVTNSTDGGVYYCLAHNDLGNVTSERLLVTVAGDDQYCSFQWEFILGCIAGLIGLISFLIFVWWLKSCRQPCPPESQMGEELVGGRPVSDTGEDSIHYGEIDFSRLKPNRASGSVLDVRQSQTAVYAAINIKNSEGLGSGDSHQAAEDLHDLYAEVKKDNEEIK